MSPLLEPSLTRPRKGPLEGQRTILVFRNFIFENAPSDVRTK